MKKITPKNKVKLSKLTQDKIKSLVPKSKIWRKQDGLYYLTHGNGVKKVVNKNNDFVGYYGHTHRGGSIFKIGDKIFETNYRKKPNAPFRQHGEQDCKTKQDCLLSAQRLSKYL